VFVNRVISLLHKRYHDSLLGILWAAMTPLLMMTVMALVFPLILRFSVDDYLTYLFSGILSWGFMSAAITGTSQVLLNNKGMMKKVYLPKIIFPASSIVVEAVNFSMVALVLHMVLAAFGQSIHTNWLYLLSAMFVQALFCFGMATTICVMATYFRDLKHILGVVMQAFFYLTPIIYPVTIIPEQYRSLMELNPFYLFVRLFHQAIYLGDTADWALLILPAVVASIAAILGILVQYKFDRVIMYRL